MLRRGLCNEYEALRVQDHDLSQVGFATSRSLIICLLWLNNSRLLEILMKVCSGFCLDLFLALFLLFVMLRSSFGLVVILIILNTLWWGLIFGNWSNNWYFFLWVRKQTFHEVVHQVDIGHLGLLLVSFLLHFLSVRLLTSLRLSLRDGISSSLLLGSVTFLLSAMLSTSSLTFPLLLFGLLLLRTNYFRVLLAAAGI